MKRILILYSEVMGYTRACIDQLASDFNVEILMFQLDKLKLTPYEPDFRQRNVTFYNKSQFSEYKLFFKKCADFNPTVIFVSGWMDEDYLRVAKHYKRKGLRVVSFVDNQWKSTLRQNLASIFGRNYLHKYFTNLWVSGIRQYEFAKRLGFKDTNIKFGFCPADYNLFNSIYLRRKLGLENKNLVKEIIYVGRLSPVKDLELFLETFTRFHDLWSEWKFKIVGSGPQIKLINKYVNSYPNLISHIEFLEPNLLQEEIVNSGVFVLPSLNEPWGVVIHEFAIAGFPIICSDACGASDVFVRDGYNGYTFQKNDKVSLKRVLKKVLNLPNEQLCLMAQRSHDLGGYLTPEMWAATAYSY